MYVSKAKDRLSREENLVLVSELCSTSVCNYAKMRFYHKCTCAELSHGA